MIKPFLRVLSEDEARQIVAGFSPITTELISIDCAYTRVLAESIRIQENHPPFDRSTMDGFAVRAKDTFGASESAPALFELVGEIPMGKMPTLEIKKGQAARIWTGGALPQFTDSVIMLEHTEDVGPSTIEVLKAVAPYENVIRCGEDLSAGDVIFKPGHRLRAQDVGLLAAIGHAELHVYGIPQVALMSSGDEIVSVAMNPAPGCVRDINRYTVSALTLEAHGNPIWIGVAPDDLHQLSKLLDRSVDSADLIVISGGSSMGSRDHVIEAIKRHSDSEILVHGVAVSPGKPLIIATIDGKPVIGLPGHPVSAMICFEQFVTPLIRRLSGEDVKYPFLKPSVTAALGRNIPSKEGRTDFVRVRLVFDDDFAVAVPVLGKSGVISSMTKADGYIQIGADCEGLYRGDLVTVHLFSNWLGEEIEKKHILRHEVAGRCTEDLSKPAGQEKLSRV